MTTLYLVLGSLAAIIAAVAGAFFRGKSTGRKESNAKQAEENLQEIARTEEIQREVKKKIQESDNAANAQDRASLIESLSADSVRNSDSR